MPDVVLVSLIAGLTVLATGLGAVPVIAFGDRAVSAQPVLDGVAIGVMLVAATTGLLLPAAELGSVPEVVIGLVAGAGGLELARRALRARTAARREAQLVFGVLVAHSLPEGLALGAAMAHGGTLGVFVVVAVAIQNIPEGTATAVAFQRDRRSAGAQVAGAVATSLPQVPGALIAWAAAGAVDGVLPVAFAAAGAAMFGLVVADLIPAGWRSDRHGPLIAGSVGGAAGMLILALALSPPV